ncbi:hypothetical protein KRE40_12570 [Elizabethkingia meningoseptica]|uniref:hypothetical protein n=1 Tax=Elizabethkingia meningoseptica TaxID=238 RepID=UPI0023AF2F52|nr:hypothetical protein [Elizabethkingia meningoseptica]MDE5438944.1 hypothetical protein [Elizabethkingia meningoseptica]MDE5509478.1 hypothetical protein [Elizabethkingia meningoseptica]MDE5516925.1 hypothetical protein [Elizabethkingia meningoseptica]MDE5527288.1 hypothetical protein [Elizabethkingia meningoseptica]MDE5531165.1 hypothetical protein [Elizabethkingia meningoseptica]
MKTKQNPYSLLFILFFFIALTSCSDDQREYYPDKKVMKVNVKGYIAKDSLQIRMGSTIITSDDGKQKFFKNSVNKDVDALAPSVFSLVDGKGKVLTTKSYDGSSFNNNFKFFYDGTTLIDKIPDVPKPTAGNVGILVDFSERRLTKIPLADMEVYVTASRLGKTIEITRKKFNDDGQVYLDLTIPTQYSSFLITIVKPGTKISYVSAINPSINPSITQQTTRDKGLMMLIQETGDSQIKGIQGTELTQYIN